MKKQFSVQMEYAFGNKKISFCDGDILLAIWKDDDFREVYRCKCIVRLDENIDSLYFEDLVENDKKYYVNGDLNTADIINIIGNIYHKKKKLKGFL